MTGGAAETCSAPASRRGASDSPRPAQGSTARRGERCTSWRRSAKGLASRPPGAWAAPPREGAPRRPEVRHPIAQAPKPGGAVARRHTCRARPRGSAAEARPDPACATATGASPGPGRRYRRRSSEATFAGAPRTSSGPRAEAVEQPTARAGRVPARDSLPPEGAAGWKGAPNRRAPAGAVTGRAAQHSTAFSRPRVGAAPAPTPCRSLAG